MEKYYRIMLGQGSRYAQEAHDGNYIGIGFFSDIDLTNKLPENWREFNKEMISVYLKKHPEKNKVSAGLACGFTYTVAKKIDIDDIVLSPTGEREYYVGKVVSEYEYHPRKNLPHRRKVKWYPGTIERDQMSQSLQNSAGSIGTVSDVSQYADEIEKLISGKTPETIVSTDESVEDPSTFALEKHLEDFLVENWQKTSLCKKYDLFKENGEVIGQQYPTDTGPIDILAISKDKKELLVIELKKGRVSDVAIGQLQRYMGYVKDELADKNQKVKGIIVALEDDISVKRALSVTQNIDFYTYKVNFKLHKN